MVAAFDVNHYVPVLKLKKGEKEALTLLSPPICPRITPLLEFVVRKPDEKPTIKHHLDTSFKGLLEGVSRFPRCFLDTRDMAADDPKASQDTFARARNVGMTFAPVTGISRTTGVEAALAERQHGLAVRLSRHEFEQGWVKQKLATFLSNHGLEPEEIDLLVDLGSLDQLVFPGIRALTTQFLTQVPHHARWRTFTLSGSAFPASMAIVDSQSHATVPRLEWSNWLELCEKGSPERFPTFSDYGVQHPKGVEDFDFRKMTVSASVRYALEEEWLLIKGRSTKAEPPSEQFPKLAATLVKGGCKSMFDGPSHCEGCKEIAAAASGKPGFSSATVWRRIGMIHHISKVFEGYDSLPWL